MALLTPAVTPAQPVRPPVPPPSASQNPSPMTETTRAHGRLVQKPLAGTARAFVGPSGKQVELWIPRSVGRRDDFDLVVHFHGSAWLPQQAVAGLRSATIATVAAVVNLGAGSGAYDRAFADSLAFDSLLAGVVREVAAGTGRTRRVRRITLVGFSAGHGAIRRILRIPRYFGVVDAVLLLDGMHTAYVPDGTGLASGGALDTINLADFANFARAAARGEKRFVVTHSEIFPGTFASTTETADWLTRTLGLKRTPVLEWGPLGMQQLSVVKSGKFEILGFAGNTAPDHIDHFQGMSVFLRRLLGL